MGLIKRIYAIELLNIVNDLFRIRTPRLHENI